MTTTARREDTKPARKLPWILEMYRSDVAKKWIMAVSGVILLGYIAAHMLGNMKLYFGAEEINHYGESLRDLGGDLVPRTHLLWIMRIGLTAAFAVHIHAAYSLTRKNLQARGRVRYDEPRQYLAANYASRTMRWSGVIVLLFVVFHLADLTWGWFSDDWVRGDVYANVYNSMDAWPIALIYIAANVALAMHIFHGAWSMFQTLGINNPRYNNARKNFARGIAGLILIGNLSFPLAVQGGLVDLDGHTPGQYNLEYGE
ncbi:MAG: succinate dehydrogenase cytochrome b subunit [Acidimicrobiia bacterium]|nr:succinate dehydrogenase cytochrome b subunit [Acidimicrobiia bacterium]